MERRKKTPWQKIIRAGKRGTGLHLSADEVGRLYMDGAIQQCAENDDEADDEHREQQRALRRKRAV